MTAVCDTLRDECKPIWDELHAHPFIDEMQAGTLPERKFAFYIGQNILFLVELARAMALGVAKADDEATMKDFAEIVSNIINIELPTNRALLARLQEIAPDSSEAVEMAPNCLAYTRHMLTVAYSGRPAEIMASLTPCAWSYGEIGKDRNADAVDHPVYKEWFEFFAGREYWDLLEEVKVKLERLCKDASDTELARISDVFRTSSRLEQGFWDMAYTEQAWAV